MRFPRTSVLALACVGTLVSAGPAMAADVQAAPGLPDLDVRSGKLAPTAAQKSDVKALRADVAWNEFGTPSSLVRPGGALGATVGGATAGAAARAWLDRNRALFRLGSLAGLTQVSDSRLAASDTHAITLRQTPGGVAASGGGLVTIGVAKAASAWKVVSAASTISGDETLASGSAKLSDAQAWQRAAINVGHNTSLARVTRIGTRKLGLPRGWKGLRVAGLSDVQRSRPVAFPTVTRGYVPAFENLVVDTSAVEPSAYRVFVDARSGAVLARENLVDSEGATESSAAPKARAAQAPAPGTTPLTGALPAQDAGCDTPKGPFTVADGSGVRAIDVFANAENPANDIVLQLFRAGVAAPVAQQDTVRTPERIRYAPEGGVPAGDYTVVVCDFEDGTAPVAPLAWTGTIGLDASAPPQPFTARWRAFMANPPLAPLAQDPWNNPSTDSRENLCWKQSTTPSDCDRVVGNSASRSPWDFDPTTNAPSNTTTGNNARTAESWTDGGQPGANQFRPVSPTRDYTFPWTNQWFAQDCNPGTPYGAAFQVGKSFDVAAAVTNLFVQHNRMHDFSYLLGFTEDNFNGQQSNFGLTEAFRENDPVLGDTQAGATLPPPDVYAAARNNANMATLPDGSSSITNMYLWQPVAGAFYPPCVDGDFDAGIIGHEYTHMIENRMIGKGDQRSGFQAGAMGEAAGDLVAIEQLNENGLVPTGDENPFAAGTYATGNKVRGIRNYAANWPQTGAFPEPGVEAQVDPLNFSDVGYDLTGPEVHADGEIWTATLWDLRKALVAKYGAAAGADRAEHIVTDGMPLTAPDPSFLDARDGILTADLDRYHGDDSDLIWSVFAHRGAGASATSAGGDDTDPQPAFDNPAAARNGTLAGTVVDAASGAAVANARVIVGDFEARVTPLVRTSSTGGFAAKLVAGTYDLTIQAPGYGAQTFKGVAIGAGATKRLTLRVAPNLASKSNGATIVSASSEDAGLPAQFLIDDTEASVWATQDGATPYNAGPDQRVTVKLGKPGRITAVQVSAFKNTTSSRFAALRDFTLQTSADGVTWSTAQTGTFTWDPPRPTAPDLHYKRFTLARPVQASYVRFFIDSVQGETQTQAQAAELQVFATNATTVTPAPPAAEPPFTDSGTIATGNPAAGDPTGLQNVFGVTGTEFTTTCTAPPASQGADGWVSKLPGGFGDGTHTIAVAGSDPTGAAGYDLDLYFLDSGCRLIGSAATASADESAAIPGGTAYVLTQLFTGAEVPFTLTAKAAA